MRVQLSVCLQIRDSARRSMIIPSYQIFNLLSDRIRDLAKQSMIIPSYPTFNLCSDTRPFKTSLQQSTKAAGTWEEDPVSAVEQLRSSAVVLLPDSSTEDKRVKWIRIYKMEKKNESTPLKSRIHCDQWSSFNHKLLLVSSIRSVHLSKDKRGKWIKIYKIETTHKRELQSSSVVLLPDSFWKNFH